MAVGPTQSQSLLPATGGDRAVTTIGGGLPQRPDGAQQRPVGDDARPTSATGGTVRAEALDDDSFPDIVEQAADRASQANSNTPRGTFVDITV